MFEKRRAACGDRGRLFFLAMLAYLWYITTMGYRSLFLHNLQQDRPQLYRHLKASGQLEKWLDEKVDRVKGQVTDLVLRGRQLHEAKNSILRQELLEGASV